MCVLVLRHRTLSKPDHTHCRQLLLQIACFQAGEILHKQWSHVVSLKSNKVLFLSTNSSRNFALYVSVIFFEMIVGSTNLVIYILNVGKREFYFKAFHRSWRFFSVNCRKYCCNSSLFNQLWKTEAAETGVYSRILTRNLELTSTRCY